MPPRQLDRDRARAGRDVEDGVGRAGGGPGDQEPAPAGILPEREGRRAAVVVRSEGREERPRPPVPLSLGDRHEGILAAMALEEELGAAAGAALAFAENGETLAGIVAAEPAAGLRVYLCAYAHDERITWLALDRSGVPVGDRALLRDTVSIMGLCELAEESAAGGDAAGLQARLTELRAVEEVEGLDEVVAAARALELTLHRPPRVASLEYLDAIGSAARRLEHVLGEVGASPFAAAMKVGAGAVEELARDVERGYKQPLG